MLLTKKADIQAAIKTQSFLHRRKAATIPECQILQVARMGKKHLKRTPLNAKSNDVRHIWQIQRNGFPLFHNFNHDSEPLLLEMDFRIRYCSGMRAILALLSGA